MQHPDVDHVGLATLEDIKVGATLFRVIAHGEYNIMELTVLAGPMSLINMRISQGEKPLDPPLESDSDPHWIQVGNGKDLDNWESLWDNSIGANYNLNRLCLTRESAEAYVQKCREYKGY